MRRALITLLLLGALACACGSRPAAKTFLLQGVIAAAPADMSSSFPSNACDDYHLEHAPVTVRDEHGTVLAAATASGNIEPTPTPLPEEDEAALHSNVRPIPAKALSDERASDIAFQSCRAAFSVAVPKARFYQIQIGTHGGRPYSFDELAAQGWRLDLALN